MKRYLVVRVTDSAIFASSKPSKMRGRATDDLAKLLKKKPNTDFRVAELTIPEVAPYSDFWHASPRPSGADGGRVRVPTGPTPPGGAQRPPAQRLDLTVRLSSHARTEGEKP